MPAAETIRIEAEDMTIETKYRVQSGRFASEGEFMWLSPGREGKISTEFNGPAGRYDVVVHYFDEDDGVSQVEVDVAGSRETFLMDRDLNFNRRGTQSATETKTHDAVELRPGDSISLKAWAKGKEYAAIDYIELIPVESDPPPSGSPGFGAFEARVVELLNELRANQGVAPLKVNDKLNRAAESHSADMADNDFFSHRGSDGDTMRERTRDEGYDWRALGENIAAGQNTPEEVVDAWYGSSGHRRNMLNPVFEEIGVGYVEDTDGRGYGEYWTQVFGTSDDLMG